MSAFWYLPSEVAVWVCVRLCNVCTVMKLPNSAFLRICAHVEQSPLCMITVQCGKCCDKAQSVSLLWACLGRVKYRVGAFLHCSESLKAWAQGPWVLRVWLGMAGDQMWEEFLPEMQLSFTASFLFYIESVPGTAPSVVNALEFMTSAFSLLPPVYRRVPSCTVSHICNPSQNSFIIEVLRQGSSM